MKLKRTYTQSPIFVPTHPRKPSTWSERHIDLPPQPEIEGFISYMLTKQRECMCLKQCIEQESQKNQKLLQELKNKRMQYEGINEQLSSSKAKNEALIEQIKQHQQKINNQIRNYSIQTSLLEDTKNKRKLAADRLFCLKEAYRFQKQSGEASMITERKSSINSILEQNEKIKQKITRLEQQRETIMKRRKQIEEAEEKKEIDSKVVESLKLIYDDIMKSLSQGQMKNRLVSDDYFMRMKKSIKNKCEIIKMGVQTHIEVTNFRRSVERYKQYEGTQILYEGLQEEEKEIIERQEFQFYSQTASSCKDFNSMKIDEVEETLKIKNISKSKTKQIDTIRVNSAKAIEDSKRMEEEIKKKEVIIQQLRQKLSSIKV